MSLTSSISLHVPSAIIVLNVFHFFQIHYYYHQVNLLDTQCARGITKLLETILFLRRFLRAKLM
jgi:hypothetical protein